VLQWLGAGCEHYNIMRDFILLYGRDIRDRLREPGGDELRSTLRAVAAEARRHLERLLGSGAVEAMDTRALAGYVYPLLRFYLCAKGAPSPRGGEC
jgi:hypothetical protein